jgi:Uma2 family endonuclease
MGRVDHRFGDAYTSSMLLADRFATRDDDPSEDHFVHLRGVSWAVYERLMKLRGDGSVPRLAYEEGVLELMSPSQRHEELKAWIGCLIQVWCEVNGVDFSMSGAWTLKDRRKQTGVEPDEGFRFSDPPHPKRPDLAIEVVWTSGGIDKRDLYRKFGVPEIWFWRRGCITVHGLRSRGYQAIARSEVLPGIDLDELVSFLDRPTTSKAMRDYRAALQKKNRG